MNTIADPVLKYMRDEIAKAERRRLEAGEAYRISPNHFTRSNYFERIVVYRKLVEVYKGMERMLDHD